MNKLKLSIVLMSLSISIINSSIGDVIAEREGPTAVDVAKFFPNPNVLAQAEKMIDLVKEKNPNLGSKMSTLLKSYSTEMKKLQAHLFKIEISIDGEIEKPHEALQLESPINVESFVKEVRLNFLPNFRNLKKIPEISQAAYLIHVCLQHGIFKETDPSQKTRQILAVIFSEDFKQLPAESFNKLLVADQ